MLQVFADTRLVVEPVVKEHILDLNQRLLDAISRGDTEAYAELCAPDLTAFEGETKGHLVKGLEFHNTYLRAVAKGGSQAKVCREVRHVTAVVVTHCISMVGCCKRLTRG